MNLVLTTIVPIFSLIAIGFLSGRLRYLGETTAGGLADFTFKLAIPALLFRTIATADMPDVSPLAVWAAYFVPVSAAWLLASLIAVLVLGRAVSDTAPISMSAGFGNVVMLGIPLALSIHGDAAAGPIALIISVHSPILWTAATLHNAMANRGGAGPIGPVLRDAAKDLARNTLILAIIAGTVWRFTGLELPAIASNILAMLGAAAIPAALVSLGLSLTGFRISGQAPTLTMILLLKLLVMPAMAYVIAVPVLALPTATAAVVIIFAAMPTGANAYIFASYAGRAINSASGAVVLGTLLSIFTSTALLLTLAK
ncbi:MAG: AEC family transporter [Pseudomonadota bacterium]